MKVSVYVVDRSSLKKKQKVQDYGNTHIALSRCAVLLSDLDGTVIYMNDVKWAEYGVKQNCILVYDDKFDWGFIITNSALAEKKMGPFRLPPKQNPSEEDDSEN